MAIIKGVEHLRIERQNCQKAESIKESKKEVQEKAETRQKIAFWVVRHFKGVEPIKPVEKLNEQLKPLKQLKEELADFDRAFDKRIKKRIADDQELAGEFGL